jgi:hypothetical protein
MRRLYYAGGTVLVGDRTCKAVLRYARALAEARQSDLVTIPVASEGGGVEHAHFLIGPASQLFDVPVENSSDAPFDPEVIEHLEQQTRSLHPATPAWDQELTDMPDLEFLDFGDFPSEDA